MKGERSISLALIANPGSGSGDAESVSGRLRAAGAEVQTFPPLERDAALATDPDRLVVAGGDGSVAPAAEAAAGAGIALAVIPAGTANDFARAMELPNDLDDACRLAVSGRSTRTLDIGRMGKRPFVNVASAGLAPVAADEAGSMKRVLGPLAYSVGAVRAGLRARPLHCSARCEDADAFSGLAWQLTVACSGAFGGGASLDADPADGALDLAVIEAGPRLRLIQRAYGMRRGTVGDQEGVTTARCPNLEVEVADSTPFNVDGEIVESGPTPFSVQPGAFELVVR